MQGKTILGLHSISYEVLKGGTKGGKREGFW